MSEETAEETAVEVSPKVGEIIGGSQREDRLDVLESRMTAQDLSLGVDVYDPRKHYDEVRGKWFGGSSSDEGK